MLDRYHGWARVVSHNSPDVLLHTDDGGITWTDATPPESGWDPQTADEYFLDARHAWFAQQDINRINVYRTSDGGRTWQSLGSVQVGSALLTPRLSFSDAGDGWLLVRAAAPLAILVYATRDGGLHWTPAGTDPGGARGACPGGISALSASTAWMTASDCAGPNFELLVTHDGGGTWLPQFPASSLPCDCGQVRFFDASHGFLGTRYGGSQLFTTSDGGATWSAHAVPAASQVEMVDPQNGWAAGRVDAAKGVKASLTLTFWRTGDGARSWTPVASDLRLDTDGGRIESYVFADRSTAFADRFDTNTQRVSEVLKTTDGGRTWRPIG